MASGGLSQPPSQSKRGTSPQHQPGEPTAQTGPGITSGHTVSHDRDTARLLTPQLKEAQLYTFRVSGIFRVTASWPTPRVHLGSHHTSHASGSVGNKAPANTPGNRGGGRTATRPASPSKSSVGGPESGAAAPHLNSTSHQLHPITVFSSSAVLNT